MPWRHWVLAHVLGMFALAVSCAQEGPEPGRPQTEEPAAGRGREHAGPGFPLLQFALLEALDADQDGKLSQEEIENAVKALATLDLDGDGKLSQSEMGWPPAGWGRGRPRGGWGGPGGGPPWGPGGWEGGPGGPGMPNASPGSGGSSRMAPPPDAVLVERIMAYDRDGDGRLTRDELPPRRRPLLEQGDVNQDGALDRSELEAVVAKNGGLPY